MLKSPTLPKVMVFLLSSCKGWWEVSEALWQRQRRRQNQFYCNEHYTTVAIDYKWSPSSSKVTSAFLMWELAAPCLHCPVPVPIPGCLSCASCYCPCCGFLHSTVIPMRIWNPSDPAHVKWVKYLGTSQSCEDRGPDSEAPGWSCPAGICSGTFPYGSPTRLTCCEGSLPG